MVVKQLIEPDLEPNQMPLAWVMRKFKRFKAHKIRTSRFLQKLAQENAGLFVHWQLGMTGTFA
jgi:RNA-directed DNA polymerase